MKYFGKDCKYFCGQWNRYDLEEAEANGKDIREYKPELVFCDHKDQIEDTEGNCRPNNCPLILGDFIPPKKGNNI